MELAFLLEESGKISLHLNKLDYITFRPCNNGGKKPKSNNFIWQGIVLEDTYQPSICKSIQKE